MSRSATEYATFSRGSTPVPSPNPPLLPNEHDDVGLRLFMIPWYSSTISQQDTITGGRPGHAVYPTLYQVTHHLNLTLVVKLLMVCLIGWLHWGQGPKYPLGTW